MQIMQMYLLVPFGRYLISNAVHLHCWLGFCLLIYMYHVQFTFHLTSTFSSGKHSRTHFYSPCLLRALGSLTALLFSPFSSFFLYDSERILYGHSSFSRWTRNRAPVSTITVPILRMRMACLHQPSTHPRRRRKAPSLPHWRSLAP